MSLPVAMIYNQDIIHPFRNGVHWLRDEARTLKKNCLTGTACHSLSQHGFNIKNNLNWNSLSNVSFVRFLFGDSRFAVVHPL